MLSRTTSLGRALGLWQFLGFTALVACSESDDPPGGTGGTGAMGGAGATAGAGAEGGSGGTADGSKPPIVDILLTDDETIVPRVDRLNPADTRNPSVLADREAMLSEGYGDFDLGPGEAATVLASDGTSPPAPGPGARRLVRFAHLADIQLTDDESPARLGIFDAAGATSSALRAQDTYLCRMLDAAVRSLNAVHSEDALDFVLLGGDNADSAQQNELTWVMALLDGGDVDCDSGFDDDPVEGPDNDPKDPFVAAGLEMPWYWVTGNHDVLVQGNFVVDESQVGIATGTFVGGGARDWSQPGGPVVSGVDLIADPDRVPLNPAQVMALVAADGDGHGVTSAHSTTGKANYTFDVEGTPLRFLVIDTAASTGGDVGLLRDSEVQGFIKDALDQAVTDGKWVVLASHHATNRLGDGVSALVQNQQADAVVEAEWIDFVSGYPNVLFSMVGHSHANRVKLIEGAAGTPWWEVMTSALADYPHQMRIVEIWDQDNGWVMLRATNLNFRTDDDPVAAEGREFGIMDWSAGWSDDGRGTLEDRNVELWIPAP